MATLTMLKDGNMLLSLDYMEKAAVTSFPDDRLQQYITLFLKEQSRNVMNEMFSKLSDANKAAVVAKFAEVAPIQIVPGAVEVVADVVSNPAQ